MQLSYYITHFENRCLEHSISYVAYNAVKATHEVHLSKYIAFSISWSRGLSMQLWIKRVWHLALKYFINFFIANSKFASHELCVASSECHTEFIRLHISLWMRRINSPNCHFCCKLHVMPQNRCSSRPVYASLHTNSLCLHLWKKKKQCIAKWSEAAHYWRRTFFFSFVHYWA